MHVVASVRRVQCAVPCLAVGLELQELHHTVMLPSREVGFLEEHMVFEEECVEDAKCLQTLQQCKKLWTQVPAAREVHSLSKKNINNLHMS